MRTLIGCLLGLSLIPCSLRAGVIFVASQGAGDDPNEYSIVHSLGGDSLFQTMSLYRAGYTGGGYQTDGYENAWNTLPQAAWVSFKNTVCTYCTHDDPSPSVLPPDPTRFFYDPVPGEYVSFYDKFTVPEATLILDAYLDILADDSVAVYLNGVQLGSYMQPVLSQGGSGRYNYQLDSLGHGLGVDYAGIVPRLVTGENELRFDVKNLGPGDLGFNGDGHGFWSFGLSYAMTLETAEAPEPATTALIALGGLGLLAYKRFRR